MKTEEKKSQVGKVLCCQPVYGAGTADSHRAFWSGCHRPDSPYKGKVARTYGGRSLLANTFNLFWVKALNLQLVNDWTHWKVEDVGLGKKAHHEPGQEPGWYARNYQLGIQSGPFETDAEAVWEMERLRKEQEITHFAMLHDDVAPEDGWLDILLDTLLEHDADLVSVAVPIKDDAGLTSTAIDDPENPWEVERRVTMTELHRLPEVFSAADCGYPDRNLLVNTGCFVCRLDRPWREHVRFTIKDRVVKKADKWIAQVIPEDWDFSRQVQAAGGTVLATRRVRLTHSGSIEYPNDRPWGQAKHDVVYESKFGGVAIGEDAGGLHRVGCVSVGAV